jgi:hypothetical protein
MNSDEIFQSWMKDMQSIKNDIIELFSLRRTFRDVAEVFQNNRRLQNVGGHLWGWMTRNYAASVLIRVRRQVQGQKGTVDLDQLLNAIINRPDVITRGRRRALHGPIASAEIAELLDQTFTKDWVQNHDPKHADQDQIDPAIVAADMKKLEQDVEAVTAVANRVLAHRTRVPPRDVTYREFDQALDALERTLQKYYALICGPSLMQAEPTPQFDTHEVFTFPWIEPRKDEE